jgi:predicted glycosyltransferase
MPKYLVDIPHPHFVHFFRNIILALGKDNVTITCQKSGIITDLLDHYGFNYIVVGKKYNSLLSKATGQLKYLRHYFRLIKNHKIDYLLGMSPAIALAARLSGKKIFFFDDDDSAVQPMTRKITIPLAHIIITPACLAFENYGKCHRTYSGYQELAYLAPKYFNPDLKVITKYGLVPDSYFIVRFNDFVAHHDIGHGGIPESSKLKLINLLETHGNVYITSESQLTAGFEKYQLKVNPADIHHVLAFARIYIGDSQTMASEAAVLGIPSFRCNTFKGKIAYLKELEESYKLTFAYLPEEFEQMIEAIEKLIGQDNVKETWKQRKEIMLSKMVDVNEHILNLIKV